MKKVYSLVVASCFLFAANGFAQNRIAKGTVANTIITQAVEKNQPSVQPMNTSDTLTNHWHRIGPYPSVDTATLYNACSASSFLAGNNCYGDISKVQKFDSAYGVTSSNGTITSVLLWFAGKVVGTGTTIPTYTATVWADNAGKPGTILGSAPAFTITSIDTSLLAKHPIGSLAALNGIYNVVSTFSSPIAIPANRKFWTGITFSYAAGDSAGLITSRDYKKDAAGLTGDCKEASTYTFEQWSDNSWNSFNDGTTSSWQLDIALGVYPVLSMAPVNVHENNNAIASLQNFPNPANDVTTISYDIVTSSDIIISVYDVTGKKMLLLNEGKQPSGSHSVKINTSALTSGMYFYTLTANGQQLTKKMSVVR